MADPSSAHFWWHAILIILLLGLVPSSIIAALNEYTNRDLYGLYRYVWVLVVFSPSYAAYRTLRPTGFQRAARIKTRPLRLCSCAPRPSLRIVDSASWLRCLTLPKKPAISRLAQPIRR